jgi:MFS family permease
VGYALVCFLLPPDKKRQVKAQANAGPERKESGTDPAISGAKAHHGGAPGRGRREKIFKSNEIFFVLIIAFISQFALSFHGAFVSVFVVDLGYDQSMIGILFCISAFSEVPILIIIHKLIKRFNTVHLLCLSLFVVAIRIILVPVGAIPFIIASQILQGPTYMISYYGCVTYIRDNVNDGKISQGQTILVMIQGGFATVLGGLAGGVLSDAFGLVRAFIIVAVFVVVSAFAMFAATRIYAARNKERVAMAEK